MKGNYNQLLQVLFPPIDVISINMKGNYNQITANEYGLLDVISINMKGNYNERYLKELQNWM